jgi:hypothetical protein
VSESDFVAKSGVKMNVSRLSFTGDYCRILTSFKIPTCICDVGTENDTVKELMRLLISLVQSQLESESFEYRCEERCP